MLKISLAPRQVLTWVFGLFALVPFVIWAYQQITDPTSGTLGEWSMLVVTVVFASLSLIVANKQTAGRLAGGMVGALVGLVRRKGGVTEEDLPPDE